MFSFSYFLAWRVMHPWWKLQGNPFSFLLVRHVQVETCSVRVSIFLSLMSHASLMKVARSSLQFPACEACASWDMFSQSWYFLAWCVMHPWWKLQGHPFRFLLVRRVQVETCSVSPTTTMEVINNMPLWNSAFVSTNLQLRPIQCCRRPVKSLFFHTAQLEDGINCLKSGDNQFQSKVDPAPQLLLLRMKTATLLLS